MKYESAGTYRQREHTGPDRVGVDLRVVHRRPGSSSPRRELDSTAGSVASGLLQVQLDGLRIDDDDLGDADQVGLDGGASSVIERSRLAFTAAASNGVPSWKFTPDGGGT